MKATGNFERCQHVDPMVVLSDKTRAHIDHWLTKFPPDRKRSAVLQGLHAAQEQNGGWLTDELIAGVAKYLDLITYARRVMPELVLTSDVIIGFPGETESEAMETVALVEKVRFDALFTFIFSPRPGTPAAKMEDPVPREEKQRWFDRLCAVQNGISEELHRQYVGQTLRCLVDGESDDARWPLTARTAGGRLVHCTGDRADLGEYRDVKITDSNTWALFGTIE